MLIRSRVRSWCWQCAEEAKQYPGYIHTPTTISLYVPGDLFCSPSHTLKGLYVWAYRSALIQVHKFGGTCLATATRIAEAAQLIVDQQRSNGSQCMVVVSAMGSHISSPVKVQTVLHPCLHDTDKQLWRPVCQVLTHLLGALSATSITMVHSL